MTKCPVCDANVSADRDLYEEHEVYEGPETMPGAMRIDLPFCGQGQLCNRVAAANKMDELARPFLEAVGNG